MTIFDWVIILPLAYGAYSGFRSGLFLELMQYLALALGLYIGYLCMHKAGDALQIKDSKLKSWAFVPGFVLVFVLVVFGLRFVSKWLKKAIHYSIFAGTLDQIAGACMGIATWLTGMSALVWALSKLQSIWFPSWIQNSLLWPYLVKIAPRTAQTAIWLYEQVVQFFR